MKNYRTSAHRRYDIKYHLVWVSKYGKGVLSGPVALRLRELVREICKANEIEILQGHISKDHVPLFVSAPPNISASKIMEYLKRKTSRKLMMEYQHINKMFWGRQLWARGNFVASSGNVTDKVILEYHRLQKEGEPKDGGENFSIGG